MNGGLDTITMPSPWRLWSRHQISAPTRKRRPRTALPTTPRLVRSARSGPFSRTTGNGSPPPGVAVSTTRFQPRWWSPNERSVISCAVAPVLGSKCSLIRRSRRADLCLESPNTLNVYVSWIILPLILVSWTANASSP